MNRLIKAATFFMIVALEVVLIDASAKGQNQPLSFDVVEVLGSLAFVFNYFHVPLPLSVALAILTLALPAGLVTLLIGYGLRRKKS